MPFSELARRGLTLRRTYSGSPTIGSPRGLTLREANPHPHRRELDSLTWNSLTGKRQDAVSPNHAWSTPISTTLACRS